MENLQDDNMVPSSPAPSSVSIDESPDQAPDHVLFGDIEYRDGSHEPLVSNESMHVVNVAEEPFIMTVEVGENNRTHGQPSSSFSSSSLSPAIIETEVVTVSPEELDSLEKKYADEVDRVSRQPKPNHYHQLSLDAVDQFTIEQAHQERQDWIDNLNEAFAYFVTTVKEHAKRQVKNMFNTNNTKPEPIGVHDLLKPDHMKTHEWETKLKEIEALIKTSEVHEQNIRDQIQRDLDQTESSVASNLADAINQRLDQIKLLWMQDMEQLIFLQDQQSMVLKKLTNSYQVFYAWLLDGWQKNMSQIQCTYQSIQQKIHNLFANDPTFQDIRQLVRRYEAFLQSHERLLPLEFRLSSDPRKEWKEYMASNSPQECIRFMKNEVKSLEDIPELQQSLSIWKKELDFYDVNRLHEMTKNRQRIHKRLEDAVETETKQTCHRKWADLNERIWKLATGLQSECAKMFATINQNYKEKQQFIVEQHRKLKKESAVFESRLTLMAESKTQSHTWADLLEQRKEWIRQWAFYNYWRLAVVGLLQVYDVVKHFVHLVEQAKLVEKDQQKEPVQNRDQEQNVNQNHHQLPSHST